MTTASPSSTHATPATTPANDGSASGGAIPAEAWLAGLLEVISRTHNSPNVHQAEATIREAMRGAKVYVANLKIGTDAMVHVYPNRVESFSELSRKPAPRVIWQAPPAPQPQPLTGDERAELERLRRENGKLWGAVVAEDDPGSKWPWQIVSINHDYSNKMQSWHSTFEAGQAEVRRVLGLDTPATDDGDTDDDGEDRQPDDVVSITDAENTAERLDELTKQANELNGVAKVHLSRINRHAEIFDIHAQLIAELRAGLSDVRNSISINKDCINAVEKKADAAIESTTSAHTRIDGHDATRANIRAALKYT